MVKHVQLHKKYNKLKQLQNIISSFTRLKRIMYSIEAKWETAETPAVSHFASIEYIIRLSRVKLEIIFFNFFRFPPHNII